MRTTKGAARTRAKRRLYRRAKGFRGGRRNMLRSVKENLLLGAANVRPSSQRVCRDADSELNRSDRDLSFADLLAKFGVTVTSMVKSLFVRPKDQDPGERQKRNQAEDKDDPLAA